MKRKGIILAGGNGTRLYPLTKHITKQLLPIYDKPMIYYPLSVLMLAEIKDILIILKKEFYKNFYQLLGNGESLGIRIQYEFQENANGIGEAFIIGEKFIDNNYCALILGDNIFFGDNFKKTLIKASNNKNNSIFLYSIKNPNKYGVAKLNKKQQIVEIIEKPKKFISNKVVTGLYFYDPSVVSVAKKLKPSSRGELEITDINNKYIKSKKMNNFNLGRGFGWFDAGTFESLLKVQEFVSNIEFNQDLKIGCIEEISFQNRWISISKLKNLIKKYPKNEYSDYLKKILSKNVKF